MQNAPNAIAPRSASLFFLLIAVFYGFWLLTFWPGILGMDGMAVLLEVTDPAKHMSGKSFVWHHVVSLLYMDHRYVEIPVGAIMLFCAAVLARILAFCWSMGLKKTAVFLLCFIALTPHFIFYVSTLYPDALFAVASTGLMFELSLACRRKRLSWPSATLLLLLVPLALFTRSNGMVYVLALLAAAVYLFKFNWRGSLMIVLITSFWLVLIGVQGKAQAAREQGAIYPLVIFETVNFLQPRPMNLWVAMPRISPSTISTLEKYHHISVYQAAYDPDYWDMLVFKPDGPQVMAIAETDKQALIHDFTHYNLWRNVPKFLGSRVNVFLVATFAQGGLPALTYAQHVLPYVKSNSQYRRFGLTRAERRLFAWYDFSYMHRWLFWTPFLGLGLLAWAVISGTRKRDWPMLCVAVPCTLQLGGIFLFSIAGEYRYVLPFFTLPLVLLPMFVLNRRSIDNQS